MAALDSEVAEAPGASAPSPLKPILVELEGGRYIVPILAVSLADLVAGRRSTGGGAPKRGGGGGGNKKSLPKVDTTERPARVQARYDAHLPSLSLQYGENLWPILAGAVLPTLHCHILCKNWEECERTKLHTPIPPEVETTITGLLKVDQGNGRGACSIVAEYRPTPTTPRPFCT